MLFQHLMLFLDFFSLMKDDFYSNANQLFLSVPACKEHSSFVSVVVIKQKETKPPHQNPVQAITPLSDL